MDQERRRQLADSYLDHLLIALKAGDGGAPFRTFCDNWYAYEVGGGHLTRGGRPIWFNNPCARTHYRALSAMHFHSEGAHEVLNLGQRDPVGYRRLRETGDQSVRLMVDHTVPLRVIVAMLARNESLNREKLRELLSKYYRLGVITSEEDRSLRKHGLVSSMPAEWKDGLFARYSHIGIKAATPSDQSAA